MIGAPPALDMQFSSVTSISPSFTSHSSNNNLVDIAARVVEEFRKENPNEEDDEIYGFIDDGNQFYDPQGVEADDNCAENLKENEEESDEEKEFEFAVVCPPSNLSPVSAGDIFSNGEILPRYPLFDRSLLLDDVDDKLEANSKPTPVVRHPLRKLFSEERDSASCSSSSEADDLDGVAPGTYCVWKPKVESPERCKKSNSTGNTSKRWKLRNLLHRSNSDVSMASGKNNSPIIVFSPFPETKKRAEKIKKVEKTAKVAGADDDGEPAPVTDEANSANKSIKGGNRIRSYLPYKPDLVGVFTNVNGLNRNLRPF